MVARSLSDRHGAITKTLYGVMGIALALYMGVVGIVHQSREASFDNKVDAYEQVLEANEFYGVIAGEKQPDGIGASRSLGLRLKTLVGEVGEGELSQEALDFVARPNDFNGIEDQIGFNPFDSSEFDCSECGPLNEEMQTALQLIKSGEVQSLYINANEPVSEGDSSLTGLGLFTELLTVWTVSGAGAMLVGLKMHGDKRMTWLRDGKHDLHEYLCKLGAPIFMGIYLVFINKKKVEAFNSERDQILKDWNMYEVHGSAERALVEIRGQLKKSTPSSKKRLREDEAQLMAVISEMDSRIFEEMNLARRLDGLDSDTLSERAQLIVNHANDSIGIRDRALKEVSENPSGF